MTRSRAAGFTLVELAVVLAIVTLLLSTMLYTLSAQTEARNFAENARRLAQVRELTLGYAVAKGRLPCPATSTSLGLESLTAGTCTSFYDGYVPAKTIGYSPTDNDGYALDMWGNRLRFAVANLITDCSGSSTTPHFVSSTNLRANGISCQPNDLLVCKSSTGISGTTCGTAFGTNGENQLMATSLVVVVIHSGGKNLSTASTAAAATTAGRVDESANLNGDRIFVWHTPTDSSSSNGEFDDQLAWITVGELYGRMIAGGVLP
jgi:prepilin-type N-terminal cleavage/methylation domain-containing protein